MPPPDPWFSVRRSQMNLSASAARAKSDFVIPGINDEAEPAGHCPIPRSSLRASPNGWQVEAPVIRHRQVRGSGTRLCPPVSSVRRLASARAHQLLGPACSKPESAP